VVRDYLVRNFKLDDTRIKTSELENLTRPPKAGALTS